MLAVILFCTGELFRPLQTNYSMATSFPRPAPSNVSHRCRLNVFNDGAVRLSNQNLAGLREDGREHDCHPECVGEYQVHRIHGTKDAIS